MTTTVCLDQSAFIANAEAEVFAASVKTIIDKCNSSAILAGVATLRIVQSGGTPGNEHQQAKKTFVADDSYSWPEIVGQTLEPGDSLRAVCTVSNAVTLRVSGRLLT
jgi:hypothetical protein